CTHSELLSGKVRVNSTCAFVNGGALGKHLGPVTPAQPGRTVSSDLASARAHGPACNWHSANPKPTRDPGSPERGLPLSAGAFTGRGCGGEDEAGSPEGGWGHNRHTSTCLPGAGRDSTTERVAKAALCRH